MMDFLGIISLIQVFFAIVIGLYFWNLLKTQQSNKSAVTKESRKELESLDRLRAISLTEPLAEKTRPANFKEIVGQEEGLKALKAALCGPNPQHVILYGPPGTGKTAAARVILEEAKINRQSPFASTARFTELDATTARFDERGIADPLIGSVHDPIYQGAGAMGASGIPQPKPGAVTKAHGGVLFIDEIGELHPIQINKLLKVLEDRKVFLESSYYSSEDKNIPLHIHEIFQKGLPADFRLIGATTRMPHEIPPAIRSRCIEIFFRDLSPKEVRIISDNASNKVGYTLTTEAGKVIEKYAKNGREAVNIVQIAAGLARAAEKEVLDAQEIEWVVNNSHISPRPQNKIPPTAQVGFVNGLAVFGPNMGTLIEIEATASKALGGNGSVNITGIVEEEETGNSYRTVRRKGMAKGSVENVLTVLTSFLDINPKAYDIHINFPGGVPIDGPSAGVSIATAIMSALTNLPVNNEVAMTGEVSIRGNIKPVGGVTSKIEAARQGNVKRVLIPNDNWQVTYTKYDDIKIIPVDCLGDIFAEALEGYRDAGKYTDLNTRIDTSLSAAPC